MKFNVKEKMKTVVGKGVQLFDEIENRDIPQWESITSCHKYCHIFPFWWQLSNPAKEG